MSLYLCHHGILGQKWGVRRFENEDGTLTEAGKKRYNAKESLESSIRRYKKARRLKSSDFRPLSGKSDRRKRIATARADVTMKKAEYLYSKAKTDKAGERARDKFLAYNSGNGLLLGDKVDWGINGGYVNKMKKSMTAKYGKEYADKQIKKARNITVASVAGMMAVSTGMRIVHYYINNRNSTLH